MADEYFDQRKEKSPSGEFPEDQHSYDADRRRDRYPLILVLSHTCGIVLCIRKHCTCSSPCDHTPCVSSSSTGSGCHLKWK